MKMFVTMIILSAFPCLSAEKQDIKNKEQKIEWEKATKTVDALKKEYKGKNLAILFKADWCATCMVLEAQLADKNVQQFLTEKQVTVIVFDLTTENKLAIGELKKLTGAASVPLLILFDKTGKTSTPATRTYLGNGFIKALEKAFVQAKK